MINPSKIIDINKLFDKLELLADSNHDYELKMLIDKIADSPAFASKVSQVFNNRKLNIVHNCSKRLENHQDIQLNENIWFNWNNSSYDLYYNGELYLDNLDPRITKKIIKDFNVAILIKHSRNEVC